MITIERNDLLMFENQLIIAVQDGKRKIIIQQPFHEFLNSRKKLEFLNYYTGQKLFDILFDDLGMIQYENNKLMIKTVLEMNPVRTTMKILGKIAEAVIVRRANEDEELNKNWLSIARRKKLSIKLLKSFMQLERVLKELKNYIQPFTI